MGFSDKPLNLVLTSKLSQHAVESIRTDEHRFDIVAVSPNDIETARGGLFQEIKIRIYYPQYPPKIICIKNAYDLAHFLLAISHDEFTLL